MDKNERRANINSQFFNRLGDRQKTLLGQRLATMSPGERRELAASLAQCFLKEKRNPLAVEQIIDESGVVGLVTSLPEFRDAQVTRLYGATGLHFRRVGGEDIYNTQEEDIEMMMDSLLYVGPIYDEPQVVEEVEFRKLPAKEGDSELVITARAVWGVFGTRGIEIDGGNFVRGELEERTEQKGLLFKKDVLVTEWKDQGKVRSVVQRVGSCPQNITELNAFGERMERTHREEQLKDRRDAFWRKAIGNAKFPR